MSAIAVRSAHALLPTDLVVVYNQNMPESKDVAEYYATKRGVPLTNLVGVDVADSESINRVGFETKIVLPLRNVVKRLQLAGHEPAILLVYGIPLRVIDSNQSELGNNMRT